jgi:hypothetical protein
LFLSRGIKTRLREVVAQAERAVFGDLCERFAQLFVSEVFSFLEEVGKVFEDALDSFDVGRVTINRDVLTTGVNSYVKQRFQVFDVLIVNAK